MAATKKRTYTARDYEDMVKIELDDAIDAENARLKSLYGMTEKEWETMTGKFLQEQNKTAAVEFRITPGESPVLLYKGAMYKKGIQYVGRRYLASLEATDHGEYVINVGRLPEKTRIVIGGMIETLVKRASDISKACVLINKLEAKRSNYSNLAARFRLGYTGDPTDLDSINKKCKEYLLKGSF